MSAIILMVPPVDRNPYPTLGPQVCAHIESTLVFGPGELLGKRAKLDPEKSSLICRFYEVYPRGHKWAGRRLFTRCAISLRKGSAKTELAAWVAACELHHEAPVRCVGWTRWGEPIGGPVTRPFIPMVASTEEQSEDLAYGALREILLKSEIANHFDIGLERIMRVKGDGFAKPFAASPSAREGALPTFQHFDETWLFKSPKLRKAHSTMLLNMPKRKIADPWALETTTAPMPGENSVAEDTMNYARAIEAGRIKNARLFFFHREASDKHNLSTRTGVVAAVKEAAGEANLSFAAVDRTVDLFFDPTQDVEDLRQKWLNQSRVRGATQAFDAELWKQLEKRGQIEDGATVALGFKGYRRQDSTALVATDVRTGLQALPYLGGRLYAAAGKREDYELAEDEVRDAIDQAFTRWNVVRMYADRGPWDALIDELAGTYGDKVIFKWPTQPSPKVGWAVRKFNEAIQGRTLHHAEDARWVTHLGACYRRILPTVRDEKGEFLWTIRKERPDAPQPIEAAWGAILSWEARGDALRKGALQEEEGPSVYEERGLLTL